MTGLLLLEIGNRALVSNKRNFKDSKAKQRLGSLCSRNQEEVYARVERRDRMGEGHTEVVNRI